MARKILCVGNRTYSLSLVGLRSIGYDIDDFMKYPNNYCLILFTGGADVSPNLYGDESPYNLCAANPKRDEKEIAIFNHAYKHGIKMTGICRGIQFLNVMSGGKLIHHLDGHENSNHMLETNNSKTLIEVNSLHHQMVLPSKYGHVIGWSHTKESNRYFGESDKEFDYVGPEVEAALFPETLCCGVQYHPEIMGMDTEGHIWYYKMIKNFLDMPMYEFIRAYANEKEMYA